ncbi:MAG TPA: peptide deformylase [Candidatus Saccharimonadales bacterium]|nr:peptide deformylase [Candidatus Saccharimonadales bacterium]
MNKSDIITLPHKSLRQRSKKIGIITDDIRKLARDMQEATLSWEDSRQHELGVALAAIQVNRPLRIIIVRNNFDNKGDRGFQVYINPQITKVYGDIIEDYEGCLSVKNIYGKVPRYNKIKIKALDMDGREVRLSAEGFLARVLQHEIDHTKGKVFIDHIKDKPDSFFELEEDGSLEPLDYEKEVKDNSGLWE